MTEEIFAYLMDDLCPQRRAAVEQRLAEDPAWRRELERLRDCLAECGDAGKCLEEPPQDLVERTCHLVEHVWHSPSGEAVLRHSDHAAAAFAATAAAAPVSGWSLADVTIGGGVLLLIAALVTPAVFETRAASRRAACESNLRTLGAALFDYQDEHNQQLPRVEPGQNAGMYALALVEGGYLTREQILDHLVCPDSELADDIFDGRAAIEIPSREELVAARGARLAEFRKRMGGSFAYPLGYHDETGAYQQRPFTGDEQAPLLSDAPMLAPREVRSVNHGGQGQNVIDQSLRVRFRTEAVVAGDDIFLNDEGRQAAGVSRRDSVLGPSDVGPDGPIVPIGLAR
jgi:hypothetical protein